MPERSGKRTEAQRRALNKYQAKNYTIVSAKVKKDQADAFKAAAAAQGTTPNAILTEAVNNYLEMFYPSWRETLGAPPAPPVGAGVPDGPQESDGGEP